MRKSGIILRAEIDPKSLTSYDAVLDAIKKLQNPPDRYGYSWPLGPEWATWNAATLMLQNGVAGPGDFRDETKGAMIETLTFMDELFKYCPPAAVNWIPGDEFVGMQQGIIAFDLNGTFFPANYETQWFNKDTIQLFPVPAGPSGESAGVQGQICGLTMYKDSKNKEAAAEVMKFFMKPEMATAYPANLSPFKPEIWSVDDRVKAINDLTGAGKGDEIKWWFDMCEENLNVPNRFVELVTPKAEVNKVWLDVEQKMFSDDSYTPEQAYEDLKAGVEKVAQS